MNWLYYLAEANLYLCVFYLAYCVFLANETYYQLNRAYLMLSCVAAFVLPVLQLGALKPRVMDNPVALPYLNMQQVHTTVLPSVLSAPAAVPAPVLTLDDYIWFAYLAGAVILLLLLTLKLYAVFKLTRNNKAVYSSYKMVYLKDTDVAFSFFNYLFIGTRTAGADTIITHELVHIRQKHSADIMFLELLKVICWFNPCIYLLQKSVKTVHEYIADEQTAATEADALTYSSFLVNNAYGAGGSSITHSFFNYNLLKKRIIMLNQQRSGNLARLKYLVALPICAGMLCASTLAFSKSYGLIDLSSALNGSGPTASRSVESATSGDTLTTSKGFKYIEKILSTDRNKMLVVEIYDLNGQAHVYGRKVYQYFDESKKFVSFPVDAKINENLKERYGYEFPKRTYPFPPPPTSPKPRRSSKPKGAVIVKMSDVVLVMAPEGKKPAKSRVYQVGYPSVAKSKMMDIVRFPPPTLKNQKANGLKVAPPSPPEPPEKKNNIVKLPPPIVTPDADNTVTGQTKLTSKRYVYEEGAFIANKKGDMFVIIYEKNGDRRSPIYRSSATAAQIKMLKNKYGYQFPDLKVYSEMPPPPPPIAPVTNPTKPTSSLLNTKNNSGDKVTSAGVKNVTIAASNTKRKFLPLIIINNQRYTLSKELKDRYANGEHLIFSATDSTVSYVRNTPYAISKWGPEAADGVVTLFGKTTITTAK